MPSATPNYLNVNSSGETAAIFSGGVQITEGVNQTPPDERRIRWVRQSDGSLAAELSATTFVTGGQTVRSGSWTVTDELGDHTQVQQSVLARRSTGGGNFTTAQLQNFVNNGGFAQVRAIAGANGLKVATLLNSDGASSFLKLAQILNAEVAAGYYNISTGFIYQFGCTGVSNPGVGIWQVNFTYNAPNGRIGLAMPVNGGYGAYGGDVVGVVGDRYVWRFVNSAGAAVDTHFQFISIGW